MVTKLLFGYGSRYQWFQLYLPFCLAMDKMHLNLKCLLSLYIVPAPSIVSDTECPDPRVLDCHLLYLATPLPSSPLVRFEFTVWSIC